jgi:hypothetical protein
MLGAGVFARAALSLVICLILGGAAQRDLKLRRAYIKQHPCPFTKEQGCILDHKVALCLGGPDSFENFQWLTREQARVKDRDDKRACAALRKAARAR